MKSVLVVDDEEIARTIAAEALEGEYIVYTAASPKQAYKTLRTIHPDCILLDLYMPDEDGVSMITTLSLNPAWSNIPVIFVTSETDGDIEALCLESGAADYIRKPITPAVLKKRLERVISANEEAFRKLTVNDAQNAVAEYLLKRTGENVAYFKSKDLAKDLGLSSKAISRCINEIAANDERFSVSVWGSTKISTWKITRK